MTPLDEPGYIHLWLPRLIDKELGFLVKEHDFRKARMECFTGEVCKGYARDDLRIELRWNYFEGIVVIELVIPSDRPGRPDTRLDTNLILEVRGRKDLWITQDLVGRDVTKAHATAILRLAADTLRDYAADVLGGDYSVVPLVREILRDYGGDPRTDWWVDPEVHRRRMEGGVGTEARPDDGPDAAYERDIDARVRQAEEVEESALRRRIPVAATAFDAGVELRLVSVELREAGTVLNWRVRLPKGHIAVGLRLHSSDDLGTVYRSPLAWIWGSSELPAEGRTVLLPGVPPEAAHLEIIVDRVGPIEEPLAQLVAEFDPPVDGTWPFIVDLSRPETPRG